MENLLAKAMHGLLYLMMIGLPLLGWLTLNASGKPVPFFGLQLPSLIEENKALAKALKEFHEQAGKAGYILIGLHAAAALVHHYIKRDNTLIRMLPHQKYPTPWHQAGKHSAWCSSHAQERCTTLVAAFFNWERSSFIISGSNGERVVSSNSGNSATS